MTRPLEKIGLYAYAWGAPVYAYGLKSGTFWNWYMYSVVPKVNKLFNRCR